MAAQLQEEFQSAYADRINASSWLGKCLLRRKMKRELRRRLKAIAPPELLY